MTLLDDQQVCRYCGKDFPLTPDGSDLYAAHLLAEVAIERGSARVPRNEEAMTQPSSQKELFEEPL